MLRLLLFFIFVLFSGIGKAEVDQSNYQLEVALLYKISKFIYWPNELKKTSGHESFNICVLHNLDLVSSLKVLNNHTIKSLPIKSFHFNFSSEVSQQCHVLFIDPSRKPYLPLIFKQLLNSPILTISTMPDFAKLGGMIESSISSTPININLQTIQTSNIQVDSSLLGIANIVSTPNSTDNK
ncbi:MAG: YfiR family protein [Pseudomonadota bacterium]